MEPCRALGDEEGARSGTVRVSRRSSQTSLTCGRLIPAAKRPVIDTRSRLARSVCAHEGAARARARRTELGMAARKRTPASPERSCRLGRYSQKMLA